MCAHSVASAMSDCLCPCGLKPVRLLCSMDSSSKNTGALLQGIFPTPELNPCLLHLLHCRWILYPLSHLGSPNNKVSIQNSAYLTSSQLVLIAGSQHTVCVCVWVAQLYLNLCDPMDCTLPGSSDLGILQARILQWVAILFSKGSSRLGYWTQVSCIAGRFFTLWATREAHYHACNKGLPFAP